MRKYSYHCGKYEILHEKYDIESMGIHSRTSIRHVPYRDPRKPDCQRRTEYAIKMNEYQIQENIEGEADSENLNALLDAADPGQYLEIDLEEEIANEEERRVLEYES